MIVSNLGIPTVHGKQFLFTGFFNKGKLNSKLSPVSNLFFLSENIRELKDNEKPDMVLWRTNSIGELRMVSETGSISSRVLRKKMSITIPPFGTLCHLTASQKKLDTLNESISDTFFSSNPESLELDILRIPFEYLRKPRDLPKSKDLIDQDKNYREWYSIKKENNTEQIIGCVIPKIRSLICYICSDLLTDSEITITNSKGYEFPREQFQNIDGYDLSGAVFTGDPLSLPTGQYKIGFIPSERSLRNSSVWNHQVLNNGEYTLTEFIRFPIRHPLYEIDVIHCDPITVEEALFTQFPDQFAHFAMAARKAMRQDKDSVETTETTASRAPSKASSISHKGVEGLYRQLIAKKQIVEAAHNLAYADYSGRKVFQLGRFIRTTATRLCDSKMNDTANLVFSLFISLALILLSSKGHTTIIKNIFLNGKMRLGYGRLLLEWNLKTRFTLVLKENLGVIDGVFS